MGAGDAICTLFWTIVWIILLIPALLIGFFCAFLYVLLSPISACCDCCKSITDSLHKGLELPYNVTCKAKDGTKGC
eukprot:gene11836-13064_t